MDNIHNEHVIHLVESKSSSNNNNKIKIKILPGAQFFTNLKNLNGQCIVLHVLIPYK